MLGERNWRELINKVIDDKYNRFVEKSYEYNKITVDECVKCLRRAYYDRVSPLLPSKKVKIQTILSNSIRLNKKKEYKVNDLTLIGSADIIIDKVLFNIVLVNDIPAEPLPEDILGLNANLFVFDLDEGVIIYSDVKGSTTEFSLSKDAHLFNETLRRARILYTLLKENKVPVIEPSHTCIECQYQERCYMRKLKERDSLIDKILGQD